jgi:hypothetical protein
VADEPKILPYPGMVVEETFQARVERLCRKWQVILRLQDWDLTITVGRWHEVHDEALAHTRRSEIRSHAELMFRDEADYRPTPAWPGDNNLELNVVHELLHLKLTPINIPKEREESEEKVVESLARAILRLESGADPLSSP